MWFATVLMLLCVQSANAGIKITCVGGSDFGGDEGCQKLFDGKQGTKWGSWDGWYGNTPTAVFKTIVPIAPASYELVIADDTNSNKGRNWKSWKIYGGNFVDDDAALDAEDWVLLDEKADQQLTTDQFAVVSFDISNPDGKFYSYFFQSSFLLFQFEIQILEVLYILEYILLLQRKIFFSCNFLLIFYILYFVSFSLHMNLFVQKLYLNIFYSVFLKFFHLI